MNYTIQRGERRLVLPHYTRESKLASRASYSSSNYQFYYLTTTQIRTQPCTTHFVDDCRVGTPTRQRLVWSFLKTNQKLFNISDFSFQEWYKENVADHDKSLNCTACFKQVRPWINDEQSRSNFFGIRTVQLSPVFKPWSEYQTRCQIFKWLEHLNTGPKMHK